MYIMHCHVVGAQECCSWHHYYCCYWCYYCICYYLLLYSYSAVLKHSEGKSICKLSEADYPEKDIKSLVREYLNDN